MGHLRLPNEGGFSTSCQEPGQRRIHCSACHHSDTVGAANLCTAGVGYETELNFIGEVI